MQRKSENNLYPPLFWAKDARETRKLLAGGADPNYCTDMGRTALCFARSPRQAEVLIRAGADFNGNELTSPLHHISDPDTMLFLIDKGADVNKQDYFRETPLFRVKNLSCAEILVEHGAKTEIFDIFGMSPLHYATTKEVAEFLLNHGADVNQHTDKGPYPMESISDLGILRCLLSHGGQIPFRKKGTLFDHDKSFSKIELYLQAGANPNMKNNWGRTILHGLDDPKTFQLMVHQYGANFNSKDSLGRTPLFYVKNEEMLRCFLDCTDLDLNASDREGKNILHTVKNPALVPIFVQRGADVNKQDHYGNTPLHYNIHSIEMIQTLLSCGADPNIKNVEGNTPLSMVQSKEVLALFYYSGADISVQDNTGKTVFDRCRDDKAVRDFINQSQVAMPIFDTSVPVRNDNNIAAIVPPDLLEAAKSGNGDYFLAMLDLYGDESMMPDLFVFLLHQDRRLCSLLVTEHKITDGMLQQIFRKVDPQDRNLVHKIIEDAENTKK
ncbi:MAG: hypothetical protein E7055_13460 [Lentisphaerae bacterium]|nr:hypothetical protein [Lentisphaerota bacterium]